MLIGLKNCKLIKELVEGFDDEKADILIEDNKIKKIYPVNHDFKDIKVIDLKNNTLLPGLIDLHMHLMFKHDDYPALVSRNQNQYLLDSIDYANKYLKQGYTTIRDCGNDFYVGVALRDAIEEGIIVGPRVITSGKCISPFAKGNSTFGSLYYEVNSPEEITAAVRDEVAKGVDFIKYMVTGSVANLKGKPGQLITSREEIRALCKAAQTLEVDTAAHCHGEEGIKICAEEGITTIEHASFITEESIGIILDKGCKTSIVPTLTPVVSIHTALQKSTRSDIAIKIEEVYNATSRLVKATRAGVLTGWGTDMELKFLMENPGYEFLARKEVGYSNIEILEQATINSAKIIHLEDKIGTIKEGKLADLIVVNGDPKEDIKVMANNPLCVIKNGDIITCNI